jgi:hypothetical protein
MYGYVVWCCSNIAEYAAAALLAQGVMRDGVTSMVH